MSGVPGQAIVVEIVDAIDRCTMYHGMQNVTVEPCLWRHGPNSAKKSTCQNHPFL